MLLPTQRLSVKDRDFQAFSIINGIGKIKLVDPIWNCSSITIIEQKTFTSACKSRVKINSNITSISSASSV